MDSKSFRVAVATVSLGVSVMVVPLLATAAFSSGVGRTDAAVAATTPPTTETARSLYLNNWSNLIGLWMHPKLAQTDTNTQWGPRLGELHFSPTGPSAGSATNQIVDYTGFFRNETTGSKFTQVNKFQSATGHLDSGGILRTSYGAFDGVAPAVQISRDYTMVPNQQFMVVTYRLQNTGPSSANMNVLDSVHLNNVGKSSGQNVVATFDNARSAAFADMSASGQHHIVLGSFGTPSGFQVGNDAVSNQADPTVAPWYPFDATGNLPGNAELTAGDVSLAINKRVTVPAGSTVTTSFYLGIATSVTGARAVADAARTTTPANWESQTSAAYTDWLAAGKRLNLADPGLNLAYDRALVTIKQSQNPSQGTWPATTNPIAYGYKTWVRDSGVTALILDAAGHHMEAEQYFRWMAGIQRADGSFGTTYDNWTGQHVPFVEPEHDAIGIFLVGVIRHYQLTGDAGFANDLWPAVQRSADFVSSQIGSNGFGPADASIWEEQQEYNTFTQGLYIAGLWAAEVEAERRGNEGQADSWAAAAGQINTALQRSSLEFPAGLWNGPDSYYNRAVNLDNTGRTTVDASSDILFPLGVVDVSSSRAVSHIAKITSTLTHDGQGIARYQGDTFYYTAPFSPAGDEAGGPEPSWPQMSMYAAMFSAFRGDSAASLDRLTWYTGRTAVGYMPPGEPVSNVTQKPIVSTMVEPVTGAWYVLAALVHTGQVDPRVNPPVVQAGANKSITVDSGTVGDWPEWDNVPYFTDPVGDSTSQVSQTDIKNVAVTNDASNFYIRIDNVAGTLPDFDTSPRFAAHVYSGDFAGSSAPNSGTGMYGGTHERGAQYMVGRWSDSSQFSRFTVVGGAWTFDSALTGVIAPQWDAAAGRVELVIPRSSLASGATSDGSIASLTIALARQNPSTSAWSDEDIVTLRYRLTGPSTAWTYGSVR
ncbi:MAG: glycoside hydrolase family 15 protein [Nocardioidaceae bacterium]